MISKICLVLLLSCVLTQANPLLPKQSRFESDPISASAEILREYSILPLKPLVDLAQGIARTFYDSDSGASKTKKMENTSADAQMVELSARAQQIPPMGGMGGSIYT